MSKPPEPNREQIMQRLRQLVLHPPEKREISIAELSRRMGVDDATLRLWCRTSFPENMRVRLVAVLHNLDSGKQPYTRFPGKTSKVRKLICYRTSAFF